MRKILLVAIGVLVLTLGCSPQNQQRKSSKKRGLLGQALIYPAVGVYKADPNNSVIVRKQGNDYFVRYCLVPNRPAGTEAKVRVGASNQSLGKVTDAGIEFEDYYIRFQSLRWTSSTSLIASGYGVQGTEYGVFTLNHDPKLTSSDCP